MTDILVVGLSSWIIVDGNYRSFSLGVDVAFALEFYPTAPLQAFEPDRPPVPSLTHVGLARYEALGQVVHATDRWWAIDVGPLAFLDERPPANLRRGSWVRGNIHLGIDPYFYFERLARQSNAPALI